MALDGLGLVFEQTGNTGAGAYTPPSFQPGNTPLDRIAEQKNQEYNLRLQNQLHDDRVKKAAEEKQYNPDLQLGNVWDADIQYLGEMTMGTKSELATLRGKGVLPNDYLNPEAQKYNQAIQRLEGGKVASMQQKKIHDQLALELAKDVNDKAGLYDQEASAKNLAEFKALKPHERVNYDTSKLLVRKAVPQNTYAAIAKLKPDAFSATITNLNENETSKSGSTRKSFSEADFKTHIKNWYEKDDEGKANYEANKADGLWNSVDEAVNVQLEQYKTTLPKDASNSNEKKTPKDSYGNGLNEDQVRTIVNTPATTFNFQATKPDGSQRAGVTTRGSLYNPQSVSNLNLTIPEGAAINLDNNSKGTGKGILKMQDGTMGIALVYSDGSGVLEDLDPKAKESVYNFKGQKKQLTVQQAIDKGLIRYAPVIIGSGVDGDNTTPIMVEASQYINTVNGKSSQSLNDAYSKMTVLQQIAAQKNGGQSTPAPAAKEKTYSIKGKTYSESAISKAAKASGMTVEEYLKELNK